MGACIHKCMCLLAHLLGLSYKCASAKHDDHGFQYMGAQDRGLLTISPFLKRFETAPKAIFFLSQLATKIQCIQARSLNDMLAARR